MARIPLPSAVSPGDAPGDELDIALRAISDVLFRGVVPVGLPARLEHDARFHDIVSSLVLMQRFALALSDGDLSSRLPFEGPLAGNLTNLQIHLQRLARQARAIARGDLHDCADCPGELSAAFNEMVMALARMQAVAEQRESALVREVAERKQAEAALRESEAHYRMISENTSDVIWTVDAATQRVTYVSPAVQNLRGYTPEEALAQPLEAALTPESLERVRELWPRLAEAFAEARAPGGRPPGLRLDQPCRDGSVVNTEVVASLLTDKQGRVTGVLGVTRDITRRLQMEKALSEQRTLAEALRDAAAALNSTLDFEAVLERILAAAGRVVPHDAANIALIDEAGLAHIVRAQGYDRHENAASALAAVRFRVAETRTLRTIAESGDPLIISDTWADPGWLRPEGLEWVRSYAGMPIGVKGRVVGFLGLDSAVPGHFTPAHVERLRAFADQVATAVENARLYEQTRRDAETKAELLREVNHRVKNNLAAIIGLLLAERRHAPAEGRPFVEPAIDDLTHRIGSLLAVHEMLSNSRWEPMPLRDTIASVIRAALGGVSRDRQVAVEIDGPPIEVSPRQANGLALAINELATNTVKYALPGRDTARITVRTAAEGGLIRIEYRDDGPGYPADVVEGRRGGVGLYLLRQSVTRTLRGSLDLSNDGGAVAVMQIKAEETSRT